MAGTLGLGKMHLILDPWLEAARVLEEERARHPRFADQRYLLGLLYLASEDCSAAIEEFEAALALNPGYARARFCRLFAARMRDGALDPAVWARENPTATAEEPDRSLWTAWFLAQSGDRTGARAALERLSGTVPFAPLGWYARGVFAGGWGDAASALEAFRTCGAAHPLFQRLLEDRRLVPHARRTVRLRPSGPPDKPVDPALWNPCASDLYAWLGTLCARNGGTDEARSFYEEAFLREGRESQHLVRLAQLALARGDEEEAVGTLARAIEMDPTSVPARIALGYEYQSQGYQDEALVQFEVAARLRPTYPDLQYNLGLLYEAQGRASDAIRCLRAALDLNPGYFQARTTLAQILLSRESWESALDELRILYEQGVRSADLQVQKAQVRLALGDAQNALAELEEAVALNPAYARSYYVLGQAYRELGLRRKARSAWQQYLEHSRSWRDHQPVYEEEATR